jgi:hypothetical protein
LGKERPDHRLTEKQRERERTDDRKTRLRRLRIPTISPRIPPIGGTRGAGCIPT